MKQYNLVMSITNKGQYADTVLMTGTYSELADKGQEIANYYQNNCGFVPVQVLQFDYTLFRESDSAQIELNIEEI